jgi:16S rRNA (cytosine1402-N4)-methyltransferase
VSATERMAGGRAHRPVLLAVVLATLRPADGETHIDGTFGGGGYSEALLGAAASRVYAIDRDPDAIAAGAEIAARFPGRLTLIPGHFGDMAGLLGAHGVKRVDGIALDLGVSSMQLGEAPRGFSFRLDGPLDMRMDKTGPSAADVVNTLPEEQLAEIIAAYGEERFARRIARAIVAARAKAPITRTLQLAEIVRSAMPAAARRAHDGIDPATRTFQALRIHVNDELGEIDRGLEAAEALLAPGGRLAVVTFHSLEDRKVKTFLAARSGRAPRVSRHLPEAEAKPATFRLLGSVKPKPEEIARNPRARSARLRAAERTDAAGARA